MLITDPDTSPLLHLYFDGHDLFDDNLQVLKAVPEEKNENDEEEDTALEQVSLNPVALFQKASSSIITSTKQLISKVSATGANVVPSLLRSPSSSSVFSGRSRGNSAVDIEMGSPQHQSPAPVIHTASVSDNESEVLQISTDAECEQEHEQEHEYEKERVATTTPLAMSTSMDLSRKDVVPMEIARMHEEGEEDRNRDEESKDGHHENPSPQMSSTENDSKENIVTESAHHHSSPSPSPPAATTTTSHIPTVQPLMRMESAGMKGVEKDISLQEAEMIEMEERQRLVAMNRRKEEEEDEIALDSEDEEIIKTRI